MYNVKIRRVSASVWGYFTENPQGGGFGSSVASGAPQGFAIAAAVKNIPVSAMYTLEVNGKDRGVFARGVGSYRDDEKIEDV